MTRPEFVPYLVPADFQTWGQALGGVLTLAIMAGLGVWAWRKLPPQGPLRPYFITGAGLRLLGCLFISAYYIWGRREDGDLFYFFQAARHLVDLTFTDPAAALDAWGYLAWNSPETDNLLQQTQGPELGLVYTSPHPNHVAFAKLSAIFVLLGFGSFWGAALGMSAVAFGGQWLLLRELQARYPRASFSLALPLLLLPNTFVWASGWMKEAVFAGLICAATALLLRMQRQPKRRILSIAAVISMLWLVWTVKPYLALAYAGCAMLWGSQVFLRQGLGLRGWRKLAATLLILVAFWQLAEATGFGFSYVAGHAKMTREYTLAHTDPGPNARTLEISPYEATPGGILSVLPEGLWQLLTQPRLWDSPGFLLLAQGLENLGVLALLLYWLAQGVRNRMRQGWQWPPELTLLLSFGLFYCAFIGISTPYVGTVVRYRAVCLPLLMLGLALWAYGHPVSEENTSGRSARSPRHSPQPLPNEV